VAARWPKPAFELATVQRFDPPQSRPRLALAVLLFVAALAGASALLWNAQRWALAEDLLGALAVVALLCLAARLTSAPGTNRAGATPART
jgi:alkylglycerol monooxygenase